MKVKLPDRNKMIDVSKAEKEGYDGDYLASVIAFPLTYFEMHIKHCPICSKHVQFELARLRAESKERLKQKRANTPDQTL